MKNKLIAAGLLIGLSLSNMALAATSTETGADKATALSRAPIYVMVKLGRETLCRDENIPNGADGCTIESQLGNNAQWNGSIEAIGGKITVAKGLFITAGENIKNAEGDTGKATNKIDFDFKTPFYKGLIIKVQPDTEGELGKLIFNTDSDGVSTKSMEINYSDLASRAGMNSEAWNQNDSGAGYEVRVIDFDKNADLATRNAVFKNKLAIASKLQSVEEWARASLISGKIDADLYEKVNELVEQSWFNEYDQQDIIYFQWRFNRLKKQFNNKKSTPALLYGGVNLLMKKISN